MSDVMQSRRFNRISKLALWPLVAATSLISIIVVSQLVVFYFKYIPEILTLAAHSSPRETVIIIESGFHKIVLNLSVWIFVLLLVNSSMIYLIWNAKKVFRDIKHRE